MKKTKKSGAERTLGVGAKGKAEAKNPPGKIDHIPKKKKGSR